MSRLLLVIAGLMLAACDGAPESPTLAFWAMGSEGEAVRALLPEFEQRHPGVHIEVQQIPWSAAHEKLLTAFAGDTLPDLFQLGNTWIPEFVALNALTVLDDRPGTAPPRDDFFPGILDATELDGHLYGLPWYVDTRLIFYRKDILAAAGILEPPRTWTAWQDAMTRIKALPGEQHALLLPMNEWQLPAILALQQGTALLRDGGRWGNFNSPGFRRAFSLYLSWFRQGFAPALGQAQIANLYREFGQGRFAMYVTGPWNIGEFQRRLPPTVQDQWDTAPLPAPDTEPFPGLSLAGGSSLVVGRSSRHRELAIALLEFLTDRDRQVAFYRLTGDLPSRRSAWDQPELATSAPARAFRVQLDRVVATPKVPEWERIAAKLAHYAEQAARGEIGEDAALTALNQDVDQILAKRRWLLDRASAHPGPTAPP